MTDPRIEGAAADLGGKAQNGLGRLTGDSKLQVEGRLKEVKGKALGYYGRAIDELDRLVEKAPASVQGRARSGLDFARRKPVLTSAILAGLAFVLARSRRR